MPLQHNNGEVFAPSPIMQYFKYKHLTKEDLVMVSKAITLVSPTFSCNHTTLSKAL